ncbi:MAG: sugar phosphate nucleotidyltransferase [bacterium]|nr:sugar phosphate nucleotidyltransferase [bacterium]
MEKQNNIYGVILAGGKGERFWPKSKQTNPKQLLTIISNKSMLEETVVRLESFIEHERILVIGTSLLEYSIKKLNVVNDSNLLSEPFGKNTALAIGYAAMKIRKVDSDGIMLVCPADHSIHTNKDFLSTIETGYEFALNGNLVTFGVTPVRPDEGYGYIELGEQLIENKVYKIKSFKEKPNIKTARAYLKKGNTLWNSGIFLWRVKDILYAIERYLPEMHKSLMEFEKSIGSEHEKDALLKLYSESQSISIDFGIMEQAENIVICRAQFSWDDVGDWNALERIKSKDKNGNILEGSIAEINTKNNIVSCEDGLLCLIGVEDLIVVRTKNETFICKKSETGEIKNLLKILEKDEKFKNHL